MTVQYDDSCLSLQQVYEWCRKFKARFSVKTIQDMKFECFIQPPYSPDFAPTDFHVFEQLKKAMGGKHFTSDE